MKPQIVHYLKIKITFYIVFNPVLARSKGTYIDVYTYKHTHAYVRIHSTIINTGVIINSVLDIDVR